MDHGTGNLLSNDSEMSCVCMYMHIYTYILDTHREEVQIIKQTQQNVNKR